MPPEALKHRNSKSAKFKKELSHSICMSVFLAVLYVSAFFGLFSSLVYLLTFYENRHKLSNPRPSKLLSTTVIVPAFNEQGRIKKTVDSLLQLNYPKHLLEIILVDDGSTDNTLKEMQEYSGHKQIKIFAKKNGGKASALNHGIKKSNGEIIISLDADSFVDKNALMRMMGYFNNPKVMAVTPAMKVFKPISMMQRVQYIEYLMGIFMRKAAAFLHCIHVTPGPFSAYRKLFFEKYGGYDESNLTEDMEMAMRIQANNLIIENAQNAYSYTVAPSKFSALFKQRIRWYVGFLNNFWKYRHLMSKRYGTLGLFYIPAAFISVFFTMFLVGYSFIKLISNFSSTLGNLWSINFDFIKMIDIKFDLFYIPVDLVVLITILTFAIGTAIILLGRILASEHQKMLFSYFLSMVLYAPLYALWWTASFIYVATGKKMKWSGVAWKKD